MIDIESMVFTAIKNAVVASYSSATVTSEEVEIPASFPCVTVVESDNSTYTKSQDTDNSEHHAEVTYTINIYSDHKTTKKSQAKAIANIVDNTMQGLKFTRTYRNQVPNIDTRIYRMTLRYRAIVESGYQVTESGTTKTVYQIYRK